MSTHIMASSGFLLPFSVIACLLSASFLLSPVSCVRPLSADTDSFGLFAFGDGYYDVGNLASLYPDTKFNLPPYGNSADTGPTGRPSDGLLVLDFLVKKCNLPTIRPYEDKVQREWKDGVSFAIIGASIDKSINETFVFSKQLDQFEEVVKYLNSTESLGPTKTKELLSNSIYLFSLGTPEFIQLGPLNYSALGVATDAVFEQLKNAILKIYSSGGRKFAFQGIGPLVDTPTFKYLHESKLKSCDIDLTSAAVLYNSFLEQKLEQWATCVQNGSQLLPGFNYTYLNYFSALSHAIHFSSLNAATACCGSGAYNGDLTCGDEGKFQLCPNANSYVWFDGAHPTEAANKMIADLFWNGGEQYARPYTLEKLKGSSSGTVQPAAVFAI